MGGWWVEGWVEGWQSLQGPTCIKRAGDGVQPWALAAAYVLPAAPALWLRTCATTAHRRHTQPRTCDPSQSSQPRRCATSGRSLRCRQPRRETAKLVRKRRPLRARCSMHALCRGRSAAPGGMQAVEWGSSDYAANTAVCSKEQYSTASPASPPPACGSCCSRLQRGKGRERLRRWIDAAAGDDRCCTGPAAA